MDSLTHLTLGACIGEIALGKKLGKKAMLWGAFAQSLPDIDTFFGAFYPSDEGYLVHRGITHSFVFALVMGLLLAVIAFKVHNNRRIAFSLLVFFFCFQLGLHNLLDTCNSYGTGLFEPFSHQRFSINLLYVADPLFTIGLIIASVYLIFKKINNSSRVKWAWAGIGWSMLYLCFAGISKIYVDHQTKISFQQQKLSPQKYFTTPTPLNSMLWYVVASDGKTYHTAYHSIWDNKNAPFRYETYPENDSLITKKVKHNLVNNLQTFADGYYTLSKSGSNLYFNILRFGQVHGWAVNNAAFAFSYTLTDSADQSLLLQKGRLQGWNKQTIKLYLDRIAGKQN